jgi:phosphoserine phosphatase
MSIAFFDIDGTLLAKPSLERRFFFALRRQAKIPAVNYFHWLAEFVYRTPHGASQAIHGNKKYLRGVHQELFSTISAANSDSSASALIPQFFPAAVQRVWWHALRGDAIVLVSGTLAPLAHTVKFAIERELLWRGIDTSISVLATNLEICGGLCSGQISGSAMFAQNKAAAIRKFAADRNVPLGGCSAYGDSSLDRWMLATVGRPFAVNPTHRMRRIAVFRNWPVLIWTHCPLRTAAEQHSRKKTLQWKRQTAR